MPSWDKYKKNVYSGTNGQARKYHAAQIVEASWYEDVQSQTAFLYDFYHDAYPLQLRGLEPWKDRDKIPIDIKYVRDSSQTYAKDVVTFRMELKPSQECNVPYYKEFFEDRYQAIWPVGLYVDIQDAKGKYNRWLVVGLANFFDDQFPSYELLPCEKIVRWIHDGVKHQMACVVRSQNS